MTPEEALEHLGAWTGAVKQSMGEYASLRAAPSAGVPESVRAGAFGFDPHESLVAGNARVILDQSINVEEERAAQLVLLMGGLLVQLDAHVSPHEWNAHINSVKQLRQFPDREGNVVSFPSAEATLKTELRNAARLGGITEIIQPRDHEREKVARTLALNWAAQLLVNHILSVWQDALVTPAKSKATPADGLRWPYRLVGVAAGLS